MLFPKLTGQIYELFFNPQNLSQKIKERKTQPFECECGCAIVWDGKARHLRSKKHINLMTQKEEQKE